MSYEDSRQIVFTNLSEREKLEGLAEDASELSKAALKMIRATNGKNWTPISRFDAFEQLKEEILDVVAYLDVLCIELPESCKNQKWDRWAQRIMKRDK